MAIFIVGDGQLLIGAAGRGCVFSVVQSAVLVHVPVVPDQVLDDPLESGVVVLLLVVHVPVLVGPEVVYLPLGDVVTSRADEVVHVGRREVPVPVGDGREILLQGVVRVSFLLRAWCPVSFI